MGLFLGISGIAGASRDEVEQCLRDIAAEGSGTFEPARPDVDELDVLVISEAPGDRISVLYPGDFMGWDEVSLQISKALGKPVFSFHIHDGDLWMYRFFVDGEEVDNFNPIPEYWGDVSQEESETWAGNPSLIADHWPDIREEDVKNYLVHWELDDLSDPNRKAHPDDEYCIGEGCQLCDFMRRLGLVYPVDEQGTRLGDKFLFSTSNLPDPPEALHGDATIKPWWKFW
jgi:hypothetical protein